jgi:hypothetical protein
MANKLRLVELSMVPPLAQEVASQITGELASKTAVIALTANTVTATTGTLPTPDGATTIANAATPTVVELLELCMEIKAKVDAIRTALKA